MKKERKDELAKLGGELLHTMLYDMLLIRRFEEKSAQMYGLKKIGGFCHLYNGQEGVAVGTAQAMDRDKDYVLTAYRDHGHAIAMGMDPKVVMAELFGKITGCSRGKGGSMHMFDVEKHFLGGNGIVGAQIPIATGVGFYQMYTKSKGATVCFFGDGAIHQGAFHESLNMSRIWELPVIYAVENNGFGMGTSVRRASAIEDFTLKAPGYDMKSATINGMDVVEMYSRMGEILSDARENGQSYLLDVKTYRYKGHSMSDPAKYRTKEELESYKQQDPILLLKADMIDGGYISDEEFKKLDSDIKVRVQESVDFAEESAEPALHTIYEDVLAEAHNG
ncbi:pyruvate dehydrogenase (acetyl-transferring) E1 component subunit alpha [Spirochaeta africana]|uniref:Pyruvate dehydrogenase E1 component subunit alpha n=1 Tax=Spirochaeta africana (strain ATCC 700263 / DSM 8902 / Z-7692) TaxID=889378 RepID=H9UK17_SPIAZ|nr:pyruvate dehydrogenase (acetyl-transferring) E1 component subunit alpha [Spirochaeta africana]AFG37860.1 pyruvate dehydrogenase E1 component, alpha subunit [Spirochaeta africana DSM 8902]